MVTFSGAALLEPESSSGRSQHPNVFDDDCSQFVSFERDIDGGATPDENTATLATFQDVFKAFMRHTPWDSREHLNTKAGQSGPRGLQTRASSTFDGLDIYSHDVQIKPRRSMQLSCIDLLDMESSFRAPSAFGRLRLRSDLMLDSYRSESEGDANTGSRPPYLVSPSLNDRCVTFSSHSSNLSFSCLRIRAFRRRRRPRPTILTSPSTPPKACAFLRPSPSPNGLSLANASHLLVPGHSCPAAAVCSANVGRLTVTALQPPLAQAPPHLPPGK